MNKKDYFTKNNVLKMSFIAEFIEKFVKQQTKNISIYSNLIEITFPKYCKIIDYISYEDFSYFTGFMTMDEMLDFVDEIEKLDDKKEFDVFISDDETRLSSTFYNNVYELLRKNIFEHFSGSVKFDVK